MLSASTAMLYGRSTNEAFSKTWPGRDHPWADHLNRIKKYLFSNTLKEARWDDTTLVKGDVVDLLDISIHPMFLGSGGMLLRDGLKADLTLVGTKVFSRIVKLS